MCLFYLSIICLLWLRGGRKIYTYTVILMNVYSNHRFHLSILCIIVLAFDSRFCLLINKRERKIGRRKTGWLRLNTKRILSRLYYLTNHFLFVCLETTSESGVSDLETSMTEFRCTCCPYGYHLDTGFMKFLDDMYGPDVLRTLKKFDRKRHDVRRRLVNEQQVLNVDLCIDRVNRYFCPCV